ncbi:MAG: TIGR03032 family protein [Bythopirellula sp.]|mgnify:CR=1 FL=1|nr:TIGR03032 family protein [Bythopirellula sp.]
MTEQTDESAEKTRKPPLRCRFHGKMADWLRASGGSVAITTYTSGKLVLVGCEGQKLKFHAHKLARPMGMAVNGRRLALAVREQILTFSLSDDNTTIAPIRSYQTGKVNAHDLAFGQRGLYFVNTRFNGLARVSDAKRFVHCWLPPFISTMVAQDRCHLNGLGMADGKPTMATAFCETDERNDWRKEDRFTSGVLLDIPKRQIIARGLCMPHSPRLYRDRWWLCNSGHGSLSQFDPTTGDCPEFCALPGFTRGLCFVGKYALVGLSKIRPQHILDAPPVRERHENLIAGVALVNLNTGKQEGLLEFTSGGNEVFEVAFLRDIKNPQLAGSVPLPREA